MIGIARNVTQGFDYSEDEVASEVQFQASGTYNYTKILGKNYSFQYQSNSNFKLIITLQELQCMSVDVFCRSIHCKLVRYILRACCWLY